MNNFAVRLLIACGLVLYLYSSGNLLEVAVPYSGPLTKLHEEAAKMDRKDREALGEGLIAAGEMLAADRLGLVSTTEEAQRYVKAVLEFDYLGLGKPTVKYPLVSAAVESELKKATGEDTAQMTPELRRSISAALLESGKAVR